MLYPRLTRRPIVYINPNRFFVLRARHHRRESDGERGGGEGERRRKKKKKGGSKRGEIANEYTSSSNIRTPSYYSYLLTDAAIGV